MKKRTLLVLLVIMALIIVVGGSLLYRRTGEILSATHFNWYESNTLAEIENANKFAKERLEKKYHIFLNKVLVDVGYDWDGDIYVPIRSITESLNWGTIWLPDLGVIQLVKGDDEAYVEIVNFFGKAYVDLDRLENILRLQEVHLHGGNIEITSSDKVKALNTVDLKSIKWQSCYVNDMKMTEKAAIYQDKYYVPVKTFAKSFGDTYRFDAEKGYVCVNYNLINAIFIDGRAYALLDELRELVDTGKAQFSFREKDKSKTEIKPLICKGPDQKVVALTFDDYLGEKVNPLLDVLDSHNVKATFFIVGNSIPKNKEVLKRLANSGHEAANHTWDHMNNHTLTDDEVRAQLISTSLAIQQYSGKKPSFFRPPGAYYDQNMLKIAQEIGLRTVLWSISSMDVSLEMDAQDIEEVVTRWAHPGAIVVMHTGQDKTIQAVSEVIKELRDRGYEFVTISEMADLLESEGK